MSMDDLDSLDQARSQWRWRGHNRPPFADVPKQGQHSVWDFLARQNSFVTSARSLCCGAKPWSLEHEAPGR